MKSSGTSLKKQKSTNEVTVDTQALQQAVEMKKANALYSKLLEHTSELITSLDGMGNILFANQTWLSKMEYTLDEVMLTSIFKYIHPDYIEHCTTLFGSFRQTEKEIPVAYSLASKSGKEVQIDGRVSVTFKNGQLYKVNSHFTDVTELNNSKKTEKRAGQLVDIFKAAIDASSLVSVTDHKGIINYANRNFCKLSGYTAKELHNQTHAIINSGYHDKQFFKDLWKTISSGKTWKGIIRNKAKNGIFYWVDSTIVPVPTQDNNYEYISIRHDITQEYEAEKKLMQQKNFYEYILHNIPVDIAVFDKNHKYTFLNKEAIKENTLREWMVGKDDFEYAAFKGLPASFAQQRRDAFNQVRDSGVDLVWLDRQIAKTGEVKYKQRRMHAFSDKQTVVGYAVDITDLHTTQLQLAKSREDLLVINQNLEHEIEKRLKDLKESNSNLENFAYSISHDLKAPARQISSFAGLLKRAIIKDDKVGAQEYFTYIESSIAVLNERINAMLAVAKYGRQELSVSEFSLKEEFDKAFNLYINNYSQIQYTFANNITSSVRADQSLIGAVVENLVSNAIKYSIPKKEVYVELGEMEKEGETVYYVRDNGIGFDMKYYDKIFALFQRLHPDSEVEGTGIGLTHVKQIIERHNGRIWAESELGKGTTFYFTLNLGNKKKIGRSISGATVQI